MSQQLNRLKSQARRNGLLVTGVMPLNKQDGFDHRFKSVALLSPDPHHFWSLFSTSPQAGDGLPDPIDRWSKDTILKVASEVDGLAVFPFEGPPYHPFSTWAQRAGVAWQSPTGLLVHADHGLWISFRGAVAIHTPSQVEKHTESPCVRCPRPCLTACPVNAFSGDSFDYQACLTHVRAKEGKDCADFGCLVRRACPVGQDLAPPPEQVRVHMSAFADSVG